MTEQQGTSVLAAAVEEIEGSIARRTAGWAASIRWTRC